MKIYKLVWLVLFCALIACDKTLLEGLSEEKSQKVYLLLNEHNLNAERSKVNDNNWKITINSNQYPEGLRVLQSNYMLESRQVDQAKIPGILSGVEERSVKLDRVLADQLENSLLKIPGVMEVRIHLSPLQKYYEKGTESQKYCAVILFVSHEYRLNNKKVKRFIAGATGILGSNIKIVTSNVNISSGMKKIAPINHEHSRPLSSTINTQGLLIIGGIFILTGTIILVFTKRK